jgi:hypothetical protein
LKPTSFIDPSQDQNEHGSVEEPPADIWAETTDRSVINMVSERLREAMRSVPAELHELAEAELRSRFNATTIDFSLRASFWREFEQTCARGKARITCPQIYRGICSEGYFYKKFIADENRIAWMLKPIQAYKKEMEALLSRGTQRLWEMVDMDIKGADDKIDVKRAELLLKVIQEIGNRSLGMAVQRIKEDRRSVHAHVRVSPNPTTVPTQSMDELRRKLDSLENRNAKALEGPHGHLTLDVASPGAVEVPGGEVERQTVTIGVARSSDPGS